MRLFVAIDLPDSIRSQISHFASAKISGAKWVPTEQVHLTLRFIGEVEETFFQDIRKALQFISCPPFSLALKGVGCFPHPKRPRVIWVGLEVPKELYELQNQIESQLQSLGLSPEVRNFSPHITLGRLKFPQPSEVEKFLAQHQNFQSEIWEVKDFHLYSSRLTPSGAIHQKEQTYRLI